MTRRLVPFLAALAAGKPVTFDRNNNQATIDGVNYDTAEPAPVVTTVSLNVSRNSSSINEGSNAVWTITASAVPSSAITVNLRVTQSGSYVSSGNLGNKTLSMNARTTTYTVATVDDSTDEANGSVTLTLRSGTGYTLGSSTSSSITVFDNDVPSLTVARRVASVNEGGSARWRISASPSPYINLTVNLRVSQSGSYISSSNLGDKTTTFPAGRSTHDYSVATINDSADETNGSATLSLRTGTGYTVGTPSSSSITILDNDEPAQATPTVGVRASTTTINSGSNAVFTFFSDISAPSDITVNFRVSVSPTQSQRFIVSSSAVGAKTATIPRGRSSTNYSIPTISTGGTSVSSIISVNISSNNLDYHIGDQYQEITVRW